MSSVPASRIPVTAPPTAAASSGARATHLPYIHRARAVAIISIVAMHCVDDFDWSQNHQLYRFLVEVFQGSTVVFFMISGYLFQHLSDKFRYTGYLEKKFKNVILPYLIVSTPGILLLLSKPDFAIENPELQNAAWWLKGLFLYFYGGAQLNHVLWFVAIVSLYYLLAPLFVYFLRHPIFFFSLIVLIPISLLAHRTTTQKYHHLQLALYFLSAYMTGMVAGLYSEKVIGFSQRFMGLLVVAFLTILFGHFYLTEYVGSYVNEIFSHSAGVIDWIFLQKIVFFFILIGSLKYLDRYRFRLMDHLATVSFAIFFLHVYVLYVYSHFVHWFQYPGTLVNVVMLLTATLACSVGLAYPCRRLFGRKSRMLIGA